MNNQRAVIITGNPLYTNTPAATKFYIDLHNLLSDLGYDVSFDAGEDYTLPEAADLWVGHSRGTGRLRFAPSGTRTIALGSEGAINHPDDNSFRRGQDPGPEHFILTDDMANQIKSQLNIQDPKEIL